jgi:hypothetical protein
MRHFGWLSFLPKRPHLDGGLLGRLAHIPINEVEGKYSMSEDLINSWKKLEYLLSNVISTLKVKYEISALAPAYPAARGYRRQHTYRSVAHREAQASREIFVLWIGLLSYLIARADTVSANDWPSFLQNELYQKLHIRGGYAQIHGRSSRYCAYHPTSRGRR